METLLYGAAAVTVLAAAVGAVAKWIVLPVMRLLREIREFLEDWRGEPARPGVPERPGVLARIQAIEYQVNPNSGSSMRDDVAATRSLLEEHIVDPDAHR